MEQKLCRICGKLKDVDNFAKNEKMKDGHRNECKDCLNNKQNIRWKLNKENRIIKEIKTEGTKICIKCNTEKNILEFNIRRDLPDGRNNKCKNCASEEQIKYRIIPGYKEKEKEYDKNRYEKLKDEILQKKKEHYQKHKDQLLLYKEEYRKTENFKINDKTWRKNNRDRLAELQANYRKRYPHVIAWRSILYSTLKRLNTPKESKTITLLGYSALDLKNHIQSLFKEGMTWENHGNWHIDHIKPVSSFNENSDIKVVCALENLQPLWAEDNLSKNKF